MTDTHDKTPPAIDPFGGDLVALTDVPKLLQTVDGKRLHYSTVYRWSLRGCRGMTLSTLKLGGRRYTSMTALRRFLRDTSGASSEATAPTQSNRPPRTQASLHRRERAKQRVHEILGLPLPRHESSTGKPPAEAGDPS